MAEAPYLVAVDFSEQSEAAVDYAVGLARHTGRTIDLVHVASSALTAHAHSHAPREVMDKIRKGEDDASQKQLSATMAARIPESIRGRTSLLRGPVVQTICEHAGQGYELLVVSTAGRTGLSHILMGSVAERVARFAPIPVLVVR
jgi:universal stress protein A